MSQVPALGRGTCKHRTHGPQMSVNVLAAELSCFYMEGKGQPWRGRASQQKRSLWPSWSKWCAVKDVSDALGWRRRMIVFMHLTMTGKAVAKCYF